MMGLTGKSEVDNSGAREYADYTMTQGGVTNAGTEAVDHRRDGRYQENNSQRQAAGGTENGGGDVRTGDQGGLHGGNGQEAVYTSDSEGREITREQAAQLQETAIRDRNGAPNERYSVVDENEISGYSNNRNDLGLRGDSQKMLKSGREWSAFNRSFANKTSDMSIGEERDIVVFTDTYAHFVTADGYMQGYVNEKIRISEKNRDRINRVEEYINGSHKERRTFDRWVDDVQREERRDNGNYAAFGHSRKTGFDVGVYEEQQNSIRTGIDEESATDNSLITSEEYVPADLLSAQATIDELQKIIDEVEQMVTNSEELET